MLAALGFITVVLMLVLIMTKKLSPLVALIAVPVVTGIISCFFHHWRNIAREYSIRRGRYRPQVMPDR